MRQTEGSSQKRTNIPGTHYECESTLSTAVLGISELNRPSPFKISYTNPSVGPWTPHYLSYASQVPVYRQTSGRTFRPYLCQEFQRSRHADPTYYTKDLTVLGTHDGVWKRVGWCISIHLWKTVSVRLDYVASSRRAVVSLLCRRTLRTWTCRTALGWINRLIWTTVITRTYIHKRTPLSKLNTSRLL